MSRGPLTDRDLAERIRRSMRHYVMERPLSTVPPAEVRPASWLRFAASAAALVAAVAVVVGVTSVLRSGDQPIAGVREAETEACRQAGGPVHIPDDWLESGETRAQIRHRLQTLPLAAAEQRGEVVLLLFTDQRFVTSCILMRPTDPESLGSLPSKVTTRSLQGIPREGIRYVWGSVEGEGPILEGGVAGPEVARVEVVRADGIRVRATLAEGVWVAWWPERIGAVSVEAFDAGDRLVGQHTDGVETPAEPPTIWEDEAMDMCLGGIEEVPPEWRLPGESHEAALSRVRGLPALMASRRSSASTYVYGDATHWAVCTFDRGAARDYESGNGPRVELNEPIAFLTFSSAAPTRPPDYVVAGVANPDVARVALVLADGSSVEALVTEGYWLATWENDSHGVAARAYDDDGNLLTELELPAP